MRLRVLVILITLNTLIFSCTILPERAMPLRSGDIFFKDGFSHPKSGWDRIQKEEYLADYADGVYRIKVNVLYADIWSSSGLSFENVIIEVDATKGGGPDDNSFGIFCRMDEEANGFYYFVISSDGYYGIGKVAGERSLLLDAEAMQPSEFIRQGYAQNHIQAGCVGDYLSLAVNGIKIAETRDQDYHSGKVGLLAGSFETPGVDIYFDNFLVIKP